MGTPAPGPGPGRKRIPNREKMTAEDQALNQIAREAEARLAAKRAARAEAREIRMKELERQQKELFHSHKKYYGLDNKWGHIEQWMEDNERYSRHSRRHASMSDDEERMSVGSRGSLRGSRTTSTLSAATLASLGGASSRRGSCDTSFSVETEASIRDMKDSLAEAEEKYRKAMVSNAQLHNEKSTLMYQVETLKEELSDMEELLWESRRHGDDRTKELERQRQENGVLRFQFKETEETLRHTEELLTEVSDLRLKSSSYIQEVSDLQEVLQWKEKKMAALERQREMSDIIRIERDRLRDDVVRLRDLLKKHGVVVSPEVSTNGETGRGEADDDVDAQSASRLAEEPSHGGRESMLGTVRERQPPEGIKLPQDDMKYNRCRIYKRSRSLNVISTSDQTKPDALKPVKGFDQQTRDRMGKHPGRHEDARKLPRNKGSEKDPTKKQEGNSLFRNEGIEKQQMKSAAQMCAPKSAVTGLIVDGQAFKRRTKPHSESVASNRDVLVTEMERYFDGKIQTNLGGTQPFVHPSESQANCVDLVSPVRRASTGKVHKSRLVPPRPVKDIILDNKAMVSSIMAAGRLNQEKQKQHIAVVMGNPSSDRDVARNCSSAVDQIYQNQERDGNTYSDVKCSEGEVVSDIPALGAKEDRINEFSTPTYVDSWKENEFVDKLAEIVGDECDGSFEDEDTNVLMDLVEHETVASMGKPPQSATVSENWGSNRNEDKALKNNGDLSCSGVSEGPSSETKLKPSGLDAFLPAEGAIIGRKSGTLENWRINDEEPVREAAQIQEKTQDNPSEHPESKDQTETPKSPAPFVPFETLVSMGKTSQSLELQQQTVSENWGSTRNEDTVEPVRDAVQIQEKTQDNNDQTETPKSPAPFVPVETWKDWSCLEKTIQSMLRGFVENQGFATEISRISPEVPESLHRWISDFEKTLKNVAENVSNQRDTVDQESTGIKLTAEGELPLKDIPDEPEREEPSTAGHSEIIKDCSVSEMLEIHPQTYVSLDSRTPPASDDQEATESTSGGMPSICNYRVKVTESSQEEGRRSQGDPTVTSWSEEFVFVEFYFAEPARTNRVPAAEEVFETQLKRHRTLATNSQSSKVRRLIEITDEIKAMAVPELLFMSLQEGRVIEDERIDESSGSISEDQEELSVGDMDSCEEVDEDATEVVVEDVKVATGVKHLSGRRGSGSHKHKTDCKIS
ncbi:myosin-4 isoform X3 [Sebastes umbrosus]|uniref:myosin-4 isoform X3 n=1 Tax=Sebastes umbrosus TaxID=72105 RepID=UPI00189F60ED|nr:myosin-4 isoform X3 [Sebastes umbrosus]